MPQRAEGQILPNGSQGGPGLVSLEGEARIRSGGDGEAITGRTLHLGKIKGWRVDEEGRPSVPERP